MSRVACGHDRLTRRSHTPRANIGRSAFSKNENYCRYKPPFNSSTRRRGRITITGVNIGNRAVGDGHACCVAAEIGINGISRVVRDIRLVEISLGDGSKRVQTSELRAIKKLRRVEARPVTGGGAVTGMSRVAIMQGRLLPPQHGKFQCFPAERWREEFARAAEAGLDAIEWIYDLDGAPLNPLASGAGIAEMQALSRRHGIAVVSLCADYFMDRPFVTAGPAGFAELKAQLMWLMDRCRLAGIGRMVLPFVDASRIQTAAQTTAIIEMLATVLPHANRTAVEIHLETALGPDELAALINRLPHRYLR